MKYFLIKIGKLGLLMFMTATILLIFGLLFSMLDHNPEHTAINAVVNVYSTFGKAWFFISFVYGYGLLCVKITRYNEKCKS